MRDQPADELQTVVDNLLGIIRETITPRLRQEFSHARIEHKNEGYADAIREMLGESGRSDADIAKAVKSAAKEMGIGIDTTGDDQTINAATPIAGLGFNENLVKKLTEQGYVIVDQIVGLPEEAIEALGFRRPVVIKFSKQLRKLGIDRDLFVPVDKLELDPELRALLTAPPLTNEAITMLSRDPEHNVRRLHNEGFSDAATNAICEAVFKYDLEMKRGGQLS